MLEIYICDDHKEEAKQFETYIQKHLMSFDTPQEPDIHVNPPFYSALDLLSALDNPNQTGLYFLDVNLGAGMNGFELAEKIRGLDSRGFIVFVTTHAEMSSLVFEYQLEAMDYILKEDFAHLEERISSCVDRSYERCLAFSGKNPQKLAVRIGGKNYFLNLEDICYIEAIKGMHHVCIHGSHDVTVYTTLGEMESQLDERFLRCHKTFIVNFDHVKTVRYSPRKLLLDDGTEIPFSPACRSEIKSRMNDI